MYCPRCGNKLRQVELKPPPEIDWGVHEGEELNKLLAMWKAWEKPDGHRSELVCDANQCFAEDYPLYYHHPFRGTDSRPGDSWSISWVK